MGRGRGGRGARTGVLLLSLRVEAGVTREGGREGDENYCLHVWTAKHIPPSVNANMSIQSKNRCENLLDTHRREIHMNYCTHLHTVHPFLEACLELCMIQPLATGLTSSSH